MHKHIIRSQIAPFIPQCTHIDYFYKLILSGAYDKTLMIDKSKFFFLKKNQIGPQPELAQASDVHLHFHLKSETNLIFTCDDTIIKKHIN